MGSASKKRRDNLARPFPLDASLERCPKCGAGVGERCTKAFAGEKIPTSTPHVERTDLIQRTRAAL